MVNHPIKLKTNKSLTQKQSNSIKKNICHYCQKVYRNNVWNGNYIKILIKSPTINTISKPSKNNIPSLNMTLMSVDVTMFKNDPRFVGM